MEGHYLELYPHQLWKVPGHPKAIYLDTLHTLDLGVASYIIGSILWSILEDHLPDRNRDVRMAALNDKIVHYYNVLGIPASQRCGQLKISNIGQGSNTYPVLKHIKGRRVRYLVPVVKRLADEYSGGQDGKQRALLMQRLCQIYDLLEIPNFHMGKIQGEDFQESVEKLLLHYGWLAKDAFKKGLLRYSMVQKTHKLAHLPDMAKDVSPRCCQCYGAESFMGLMVGIAKRSVAGAAPHTAAATIVMKYRLSMHLLLRGYLVLD